MDSNLMNLKVLLPFRIFATVNNVTQIVLETAEGSYGILPQRLDCVAALIPGIFTYETDDGVIHYIAVDDGILIKAGLEVFVSVRNAIGGVDLGMLRESVEKEFVRMDESEIEIRTLVAKMERDLVSGIKKLRKE